MQPNIRRVIALFFLTLGLGWVFVGTSLAAPSPSVTLGGTGNIPIGTSPIPMSVTFDNTAPPGAANIGYGPFIDLYFPVNGADGAAGTNPPLDGIDYIPGSATYLGIPVTETILTFPAGPLGVAPCPAGQSQVTHPYAQDTTPAPIVVCGIPGDKLVVFQLPFGSFTPEQPPATVEFSASMSNFADLNVPLNFHARGGFQFGTDPLDNPCCDPTFFTDPTPSTILDNPAGAIIPTLIEITKTNTPPEGEVATGPNFPHTYTITVTAAPGQIITNLDVFDYIDDNIVVTGISAPGSSSVTLGGVPPSFPVGPVVANGTANRIVVVYPSFSNSVSFTVSYFVPLLDASGTNVIPPNNGAATITENRANAIGDWDPLDPRDAAAINNAIAGDVTCPACPPLVTHENLPLPIQKSNQNLTDSNNSPGDVIRYTLRVQVSDFFALDDIRIVDVISDGQRITGNPVMSFTQHGANFSNAVNAGNFQIRQYFTGGAPGPAGLPDADAPGAIAGDTVLVINVSAEVLAELGLNDILGGCVPAGGTGGPNPNCSTFNGGATTFTITYETTIQDAFTDQFPSGDPSVDHGDVLDNVVRINAATVLNTANLAPTGSSAVVDNSGSGLEIAQGSTQKTIYAVTDTDTGTVTLNPPGVPEIRPGDIITFRLRYNMPSTDFEDFSLSDYLPLPVLDANEVITFNDVTADGSTTFGAGLPAAGQAMWGPTGVTDGNTNFRSRVTALGINLENGGTTPTITTPGGTIPAICGGTAIASAENYVNFCFGNYDDPFNVDSIIDVLFSVTVSDDPFADDLFLTNLVRGGTGSTNAGSATSDEIVRFRLRQPILFIKKGVLDTSNPGEGFTNGTPGTTGVTFAPAGSPATPSFTGDIESGLGGGSGNIENGLDANANGVDAGDTVRYVITIQNRGGSAAFDIRLFDTLPVGLLCNPATLNLRVAQGDGTPVAFTVSDGSGNACHFFTTYSANPGIELVDPAEGLCQHPTVDPAKAVIVITYDLTIDNTVAAGDILTNVTTLTSYAGSEGGPSHLGTDPSNYPNDDASVEIAGTIEKEIIRTSEADSSDVPAGVVGAERPVFIGEVVTYRVYTRIPEGTTNNLQLRDNTPNGLQYVAGSARFAFISNTVGNIVSSNAAINAAAPGLSGNTPLTPVAVVPPSAISGGTTSGEDLLFSFGNVTNNENDDGPEFIVVEFDMVVNNIVANQSGTNLLNTATLRKNGADLVTSDADPSDPDNDPIALRVLEPNLTIGKVAGGVPPRDAGDTVPYTITISNTGNAPAYNINVTDTLPATLNLVSLSTPASPAYYSEESRTVVTGPGGNFSVVVARLNPGDSISYTLTTTIEYTALVAVTINNTATVRWTSLPGTNGTGNATPGGSGTSTGERNGSGGVNDYTASSTVGITLRSPAAAKSIRATSEAHTSDASLPQTGATQIPVAIGEVVRYRLTITVPEGTSPNMRITDQLSAGIEPIFDATTEISTLNFAAGTLTSTTFGAALEAANSGVVDLHDGTNFVFTTPTYPINLVDYNAVTNLLTFNLGTIVNNDSDADLEQILIEFNVVVRNTAATNLGNIIANQFVVFTDSAAGVSTARVASNTVNLRVVEPQLTLTKSVSPTTGDAGDTFTYTLTVSNANTANNATAFEVRVTDDLAALVDLDLTAVNVAPATGVTDNSNLATDQLDVTIASIAPGGSVTITLTVTLRSSATPNEIITNTAAATWTSLPGTGTTGNPTGSNTPGGTGASTGERDGSGTPANNDYRTTGSTNITVDQVEPVKSIIATSESHTSNASLPNDGSSNVPVAIGEVVTFQLVVSIPEGTSDDVVLRDVLVPGLDFIAGSARVYTNSAVAMNFADLGVVPNTAPGALIPVDGDGALPAAPGTVVYDPGTREVQINLGDITNLDSDPDAEQVIVTFQVVVLNSAANNLGTIWTNTFSVSVNGNTPVTSNAVSGIVQEPVLDTTKSINTTLSNPSGTTTFDGGDTVVYDIVITAGNAANQTTAFDLRVLDGVDANLDLVNPVAIVGLPAYASTTDNSDYVAPGQAVDLIISELRPGDSFTVRVTATVRATVTIGQIIANQADLTWTSLPGPQGTGGVTPGSSGGPTGERNGSGGTNDYTDSSTVNFTVGGTVSTTKTIDGTSEAHTSDSTADTAAEPRPLAIGEVLTYRLVTSMPEGTSPDVQVIDILSPSIEFIPGSARISYSANNAMNVPDVPGILNELNPTTPVPAGLISFGVAGPRTLRFDVGQVVNNDTDNAASEELLIIEFQVVVVNSAGNNLGTIWANDYSVDLNNDGTSESTSNQVFSVVQEPVVTASKAIVGTPPDDAFDTITYDLTITAGNAANQSTAFDLNVVDVLDSVLRLDSVAIQVNPGYVSITADNSTYGPGGGGPVNIVLNRLEPGNTVVIRVVATVLTSVAPGQTIDNFATITWTSLPGPQGTGGVTPGNSGDPTGERNGSGGVNDHTTPTNTVSFTINVPTLEKSIAGTSEPATSDTPDGSAGNERPVAIGEVVRYRLVAILPESTTISLRMDDVLAAGIEFVPGTARVSYLANTAPTLSGDFAGIQNEATPTLPFPASRISFDAATRLLSFSFGSVINNDGDADQERLILEFDVVVVDEAVNSIGQIWANDYDLVIDEGLPTEIIISSNTVSIRVVEPRVTMTKTFSPDEQVRGGTTTMTLVVSNLAASGATAAAFDLNVTDVLDDWLNVTGVTVAFNPAAIAFGSTFTDNSVLTPGFAAGVTDNIDVVISALPIDGVATITVTMQIDPNADPLLLSRAITNTATVVSDTLSTDVTPDDEDREYTTTGSDDLNVVKPTLLVSKTDSTDPVAAGALMSYTVTIQNTGTPNFAATGVIFQDQLPASFIVTLVQPSQGTCSPIVAGLLTCNLGTIASGASANVVITGRYPATTPSGTVVNNISHVRSNEGNNGNDGNDTPDDNDDERAEEPTTIVRQVDLALTKIVDDPTPNEGDLITYTINIVNNGPSQATNVVLTDSLPAGLTFVRFVPTGAPCVFAAPTLTCTYPILNVGAIRTVGIEATVNPGTAGTQIVNSASVLATEPEANILNNIDDAVINIDSVDLRVVKTVSNSTPSEGGTISYTITVTNLGPAPATGVEVTDNLNAVNGITYVSDNSASTGTTYNPATGVWSLTGITLTPGASASLVIVATVDTGASGLAQPIVNNAVLSDSDQPDTNPANNTGSASIAVGGLDLRLTKGVNNATVNEGNTVIYSIVVENLGAANATNIVVLDQLDTIPVTYVSHTANRPGTTYNPVTGQWTIPSLLAGQSIRLDITVTINAGTAGTTITNVASISSLDQSDSDPTNNSDDAVVRVRSTDVGITKTVNNATPGESDTIVYSLTVINNGPATATGVTVTDNLNGLPLSYVSDNSASLVNSVGAATSYTPATGLWTVGTLNPGVSLTLQITVTVNAGTSGTNVTNFAQISGIDQPDTNPNNDVDDAVIAVSGLDLRLTKDVDNAAPSEGDTLVYSITLENLGPANATNIVVTDDLNGLPLSYVSDNSATLLDSLGAPTSYTPATGAWSIGNLDAGASLTLQITVTVNAGTSGTSIVNNASITAVDQPDSNPNNNADNAVANVGGVDLAVTKVVDNPTPAQGQNVTYTITVVNNGPGTATGVVLSENLPLDGVNLTYVSHVASQGTFIVGTPGTWNIGTLTNGQSVTLTLTVTVEISDGQILNVASILNVDQPDRDPSNNSDDATITLNGVDLAVVKTVDNATPETGDTITYSVVARNNGPATATGVVVVDILPAGVNYVSDNAATLLDDLGAATSYDVTTGDWTIGTLNAGSSRTLTITVTVLVSGGQVINTAEISGNEPESDPRNNIDDAVINVDSADLSLTKGISTTTPQLGDFFTYTVTVSNAGPNTAFNVAVTDYLPTTVTYSSHVVSQGSFNPATGVWTVGTLPVNGAATLQLTVQLTSLTGTFVNIAEVSASNQPDPDSTPNNLDPSEDDYAESSFLFDPPFGRKVFDASGLPELEWTIIWVNPNTAPLAVTVTDPIPAGTSFVNGSLSCTSPGTLVVNTCSFDIISNSVVFSGTLFPDPGVTPATIDSATNPLVIRFRVIVDNAVREVFNEATLRSVNGDNVSVGSTWTRPATPEEEEAGGPAPAQIELTKYADPPIAFTGETLTWVLEVRNPSGNTATGVVVTDTIPDGLIIEGTEADAGTVNVSGQFVRWEIGNLGAGQTLVLRIVTRVSVDLREPVTNTALANGSNFEQREASATAFVVFELPATGETPWWRDWVLASIFGGTALVIGLWARLRS